MAGLVELTDADVARWRDDTPGTATRTHLNNAGASLMPRVVKAAIDAHLQLEMETGGYEAAAAAAPAIDRTYADTAQLIGAKPHNIAIVSSATAAYAQAMSTFDFAPGDVIVTSAADYISNQIMFLSLAARRGVRIERADDAPEGGVDPASVRTLVRRHRPRLVSITWVPTNGGLVQPAAEVGAVCEAEGVPFLLDACQAVGQLAIDVAALRCDFLSATARKFLRGPRGIGFLYASDAVLARGAYPLLVDMRGAMWSAENAFTLFPGARRFEEWEFPYALVLGLGAAARYALEAGIARTAARAHTLAAAARRQIGAIPGVRSLDREARLSAIAAFAFESHVAHDVMHALRARAINTSALARSDAVIDMSRKGAETALRVSPHYFNTGVEIDGLEAALKEVISG